jgi:hypothetical protein
MTMEKLSFDRSAPEGLILRADDGAEFTLTVSPELRAAVRTYAPPAEPEPLPVELPAELKPKDIQGLVRAGADPETLARESGRDLAYVERYAAPVLDERRYVAERASAIPVPGPQNPVPLAELAAARLEAKSVDPEALVWDAAQSEDGWVLRLTFPADSGAKTGRWAIDLEARTLLPLDRIAEWIVEPAQPDAPVPAKTRHLTAVADEPAEPGPDAAPPGLLDDLMDSRGLRQPPPPPPGGDASPPGPRNPARVIEFRPVATPGTQDAAQTPDDEDPGYGEDVEPTLAAPAYTLERALEADGITTERVPIRERNGLTLASTRPDPGQGRAETDPDDDPPPGPKPRRAKRSSVPSWDEIVFGAGKSD